MTTQPAETPQRRKIPRDTFASRLVWMRHDLGLNQPQMAELCGINKGTWSLWEHGTAPRGQAQIAHRISLATGYDRDWLLFGNSDDDPELPRKDSNLEPAGVLVRLRRTREPRPLYLPRPVAA